MNAGSRGALVVSRRVWTRLFGRVSGESRRQAGRRSVPARCRRSSVSKADVAARDLSGLTRLEAYLVLYKMRTVRVPIAEVRKNLAALVREAERGSRIKITRYDKTLAGIVPKEDLGSLEECDELRAGSRGRRR